MGIGVRFSAGSALSHGVVMSSHVLVMGKPGRGSIGTGSGTGRCFVECVGADRMVVVHDLIVLRSGGVVAGSVLCRCICVLRRRGRPGGT